MSKFEDLDTISHLFPSNTRNTTRQLSSLFIKKRAYLTTPAEATEANGTSLERTSFVVGETRRRGTRRVRDTASRTEVRVAAV